MIGKNKKNKKKAEADKAEAEQTEEGEELSEFEQLQQEKLALEDKLLRAQADLQNVRRRQFEELQRARDGAFERLLGELLPVVDALSFAEKAGSEGEELRQGFLMFKQIFEDLFQRHGVTRLVPEGETFDPMKHEALAVQIDDSVDAGTILAVHQDGLMLGDKVLRAARVVVSQRTPEEKPAETGESTADAAGASSSEEDAPEQESEVNPESPEKQGE
jgi:molecular chaperone GrpE